MFITKYMYLHSRMGRIQLSFRYILNSHINVQYIIVYFIPYSIYFKDIDECAKGTDLCQYHETCANIAGSYNCGCPHVGDKLGLDGHHCISIS